jgi:hypothetical protein
MVEIEGTVPLKAENSQQPQDDANDNDNIQDRFMGRAMGM